MGLTCNHSLCWLILVIEDGGGSPLIALPTVSCPLTLDMDEASTLDQVSVSLGRQLQLRNGSLFEDVLSEVHV